MYILAKCIIFEKNTMAIVHSFIKKWHFGIGIGNESFSVRMYVYMY